MSRPNREAMLDRNHEPLSNTLDTAFCVEAALAGYGRPEISNTDQGSQFTSNAFTSVLIASNIRISMDGRERCLFRVPHLVEIRLDGRDNLNNASLSNWT